MTPSPVKAVQLLIAAVSVNLIGLETQQRGRGEIASLTGG